MGETWEKDGQGESCTLPVFERLSLIRMCSLLERNKEEVTPNGCYPLRNGTLTHDVGERKARKLNSDGESHRRAQVPLNAQQTYDRSL
jgi:hypothetical protein